MKDWTRHWPAVLRGSAWWPPDTFSALAAPARTRVSEKSARSSSAAADWLSSVAGRPISGRGSRPGEGGGEKGEDSKRGSWLAVGRVADQSGTALISTWLGGIFWVSFEYLSSICQVSFIANPTQEYLLSVSSILYLRLSFEHLTSIFHR